MRLGIRICHSATVCSVMLLAAVALAQRGPGGGPGRGFGPGPADLLQVEQVQTELQLTDDQKASAGKLGEMRRGMRDLSEEDRQKRMGEIQAKVDEILKPEQKTRLEEIVIQVQGPGALGRPEIQEKLGLSDEQRKKLDELNEEMRGKRREVFQSGSGPEKLDEIRKEQTDKANAILTDQQREQFDKLQGKKIEIDRTQLFPGRNR